MEEKDFYESLMQYFVQNKIDAMVYHDTFTHERYAAFGKETIGIPRLFIDRDKSIGNIDTYGIEFYEPLEKQIINDFQNYAMHLHHFLKIYHKQKGNGYIIYRRNKSFRNHFLKEIENDVVYSIFEKDHCLISSGMNIFHFLNHSSLHWCLYSNSMIIDTFKEVEKVFSSLKELSDDKSFELGNTQIINSNLFTKGIHFKLRNKHYVLSFLEGKKLMMELRMIKHHKSSPLVFDATTPYKIKEKIEEIEQMNRLLFLFE